MSYSALLIDVIESRRYADRLLVQELLKRIIGYLNEVFRPGLAKEAVFGAGDEMQGLFVSPEAAFLYFRKLQLLAYPVLLRGGIGAGEIKYYRKDWPSTEHDGEAYYRAREALAAIPSKDDGIVFYKGSGLFDKFVNMYMLANGDIKAKQSPTARMIELLIDLLYPIFDREAMEKERDREFYRELFKLKDLLFGNNASSQKRNKLYGDIDIKHLEKQDSFDFPEPEEAIRDELFIDYFWKKGYSTLVAEILGMTRQNVDKHISKGKIKLSRNMDGTIMLLLKRVGRKI